MLKEFKTIAEQIHVLETRGMRIGEEASTILLRENYYSIVNGYKDAETLLVKYSDELHMITMQNLRKQLAL
ncbi:hypothetical protein [uncultured Slackia sp.]|uniref:hypothetical protein n=1 Tax=uncultured Slackia sp. TaxID=665903 RepID=UPI0025CF9A93|nr:hypothetical protein [uncultured Slackia sp.]